MLQQAAAGTSCSAAQFVHIPKTGGSSLEATLRSAAKLYNLSVTLQHSFTEASKNVTNGLVVGHNFWGWGLVSCSQPRYIVLLREPGARLRSLYANINWSRRKVGPKDPWLRAHWIRQKRNLSELIFARDKYVLASANGQTAYLAGKPPVGLRDDKGTSASHLHAWYLSMGTDLPQASTRRALQNLYDSHIVATTENMTAILPQLHRCFGWSEQILRISHSNANDDASAAPHLQILPSALSDLYEHGFDDELWSLAGCVSLQPQRDVAALAIGENCPTIGRVVRQQPVTSQFRSCTQAHGALLSVATAHEEEATA